jgi:hypothetical protein
VQGKVFVDSECMIGGEGVAGTTCVDVDVEQADDGTRTICPHYDGFGCISKSDGNRYSELS